MHLPVAVDQLRFNEAEANRLGNPITASISGNTLTGFNEAEANRLGNRVTGQRFLPRRSPLQ